MPKSVLISFDARQNRFVVSFVRFSQHGPGLKIQVFNLEGGSPKKLLAQNDGILFWSLAGHVSDGSCRIHQRSCLLKMMASSFGALLAMSQMVLVEQPSRLKTWIDRGLDQAGFEPGARGPRSTDSAVQLYV